MVRLRACPLSAIAGSLYQSIEPKLQMQNSYDVAALTKNDMVNRPLKQAPDEKKAEPPEVELVVPGLEGRYTQQADGSILVHDGIFTTKGGTIIRLKESILVRANSTVSISGGPKDFITQLPEYEDEDDYPSDDFTSSDEDEYDDDDDEYEDEEEEQPGWEDDFQQLMDKLVL
jgi:hypothetical protein